MIDFFSIGQINELVLKGHSYISEVGIKIIDDKNCKGSTNLEKHFYEFLELLEVIELRKDVETTDDKLQKLVLRLYGYVENECIYYNGLYLGIDDPMYSGSVSVDTSNLVTQDQLAAAIAGITGDKQKTKLDITDNNSPTVIDWNNDIVPDGTLTWAAKHGRIGYLFNAKWKNNISGKYEKNESFTIEDEYDTDDNLELVTINVSDIPFRFIIL